MSIVRWHREVLLLVTQIDPDLFVRSLSSIDIIHSPKIQPQNIEAEHKKFVLFSTQTVQTRDYFHSELVAFCRM